MSTAAPSPRTKKTASGTNLPKRTGLFCRFLSGQTQAPRNWNLASCEALFRTYDKTAGKTCQNEPVPKWKVLLEGGVDGLDEGAAHAGVLERDDALDGGAAG